MESFLNKEQPGIDRQFYCTSHVNLIHSIHEADCTHHVPPSGICI